MPAPYRPHRTYPGQGWTLAQAAGAGQLVELRCRLCRRLTRFLASDLAALLDPRRDALAPPFPCSRCGCEDHVTVRLRVPAPGDWGHLVVRRPAGVVRVQKWKSVRLGE